MIDLPQGCWQRDDGEIVRVESKLDRWRRQL